MTVKFHFNVYIIKNACKYLLHRSHLQPPLKGDHVMYLRYIDILMVYYY